MSLNIADSKIVKKIGGYWLILGTVVDSWRVGLLFPYCWNAFICKITVQVERKTVVAVVNYRDKYFEMIAKFRGYLVR